ncbi:MAG: InlB B-repeat-containing protein [Christensenellales bacterium]
MKKPFKLVFALCLGFLALLVVFRFTNQEVVSAETVEYMVTFNYNKDRVLSYILDETGNIAKSLENYTTSVSSGGYAVETKTPNSVINQYYSYTWTVDGVDVNLNNYVITKNTEFLAKWTPKEYKVYFNYSGVESEITNLVSQVRFTVESPRIVLYTPNRPNYAFKGWYDNPNDEGSIQYLYITPKSVGDKVLYAKFSPIEYYIEYNTEATHNNPRGYNVEDLDFDLQEPTLYGHIFKGWYLDKECTLPVTKIDCSEGGNIELYPKWDLETYKVTYILPNGLTKVMETEYGSTADLPKLEKSIFEIVITSTSRNNITEDTTIEIKLVNIWYVYLIAIVLVVGTITIIVVVKKRREKTHNNLRNVYQSNTSKRRKY